ncbi:MAG: trigger factor [Eubacterium sp.]
MSAKVLSNEKNIVTIEIEVSAEDFQKAIKQSYNKSKNRFSVQGFRKGKAPRKIIESYYGKGIFYEDAIDFAFPDAYKSALEETDIKPITRPALDKIDKVDEEGATYIVKVGVKPSVILKEYKGAEIDSLEAVIEEEDIVAELKKMQEKNARMVTDENAEAKLGDTVNIDYEGFVGDEAFEGGKAEGHSLELGSNSFIPGFEEQLVGIKTGDSIDVKVTFPEEYYSEDLKGKEAIFKVKANEVQVKELPELDDEFAKDVSEFDTLRELKADTAAKLKETKTQELRRNAEIAVLDFAVENAEVDVPYLMIEEEVDGTIDGYARQMEDQGISFEDYLKYTGTTAKDFGENLKPDVEKKIKSEFVLREVAEVEKLDVTDEEIDDEIRTFADAYKQDFDEYKATVDEGMTDYLKGNIKRKKAIELLIDSAKVK